MEGSFGIKTSPVEQVAGRVLTHLKNLDPESRNRRVAELYTSGAPVRPTLGQLVDWAGATSAGVTKALNGHGKQRTPSPALAAALTDLEILLTDVADTAMCVQWRSAEFERAALEDLDQRLGQYRLKHESALEVWADRGGAKAQTLAQAVRAFDRLLTAILSNNNIG